MMHKGIAEAGINSMLAGWIAEADEQANVWRRRSSLPKSAGRAHLSSNARAAGDKLADLARNYRQGA